MRSLSITAVGSRATSCCQLRSLLGEIETHQTRTTATGTTAATLAAVHGRIITGAASDTAAPSAAASVRFPGPSIQSAATLQATAATMTR